MKKILFATKDTGLVDELKRGYYLRCVGQVEYYDLALELAIAAAPDGVVLADDLLAGIGQEGITFHQCGEAIRQANPETIVIEQRRMAGGGGLAASSVATDLGLERRPAEDSLIIAVYSLRGGVGKSTTAANLAWELAQGSPSILLDLDLRGGTIRHLLGAQEGEGGLYQLARSRASLNGDLVSYLALRGPLALLLPPEGMEACLDDSLSGEFLSELIRQLALHYTNVVIDLAPDLVSSPAVLAALVEASRVLLLAQPTRVGLAGLPQLLPVLADLRIAAKVGLVLSRVRGEVDAGQLSRDLGIPVVGRIPEDKAVLEAEEGRQPVVCNPRSPAGQALRQLAGSLRGASKASYRQGG